MSIKYMPPAVLGSDVGVKAVVREVRLFVELITAVIFKMYILEYCATRNRVDLIIVLQSGFIVARSVGWYIFVYTKNTNCPVISDCCESVRNYKLSHATCAGVFFLLVNRLFYVRTI